MTEVVVVTGASAGVGRAIAHAFARRGARVGLLARGEPGLQAAAREVEELGGSAHVVATMSQTSRRSTLPPTRSRRRTARSTSG